MLRLKSKIQNPKSKIPKVVGLSGGIASGKTMVARMFGSLGAVVISADEIAHEVVNRASVRRRIVRRWGRQLLKAGGSLDRRKLASKVFSEPGELRALEAMTHPEILREIQRRIRRYKTKRAPLIVLDAPLLYETRLDRLCDVEVFILAGSRTRYSRAKQERGWTPRELRQREAQQVSLREKRARADRLIVNFATPAVTRAQVRQVWNELVSLT
jgi:dephospho-CoA kinase